MKNELKWVQIARQYIGQQEIKGVKHNPLVVEMWTTGFTATNQAHRLKEKVRQNDETPWCGAFVAFVMAKAGLSHHIPKSFPLARSWVTAGSKLNNPAYGCVVVFSRNGGGHVGFCVGRDKHGNIMVLGGNKGDAVNIKPFSPSRVLGYRWCGTQSMPATHRFALPVFASNGKVSTNEA
ncbi:TIGR02594 family protein [Moraxella haemolytica]|uniref:NlpC/P60 family protein n=1 Tax=Moraxella haemolytica TaxID=2904119 RepID=UPI002542824E|nr:TIGR02594 family protein [Moraxella sp. ZY171148]WII96009.1 TIGR02594 family protein [Moraxella sp. ZY171148]